MMNTFAAQLTRRFPAARRLRTLAVLAVSAALVVGLCRATEVRALSGELRFEHIGEHTALSDAIVTCILQDRRGFLWFGTYESGLFRYDGYRLTRFAHDPRNPSTLSSNRVWTLAEDGDGFLWVGTWGHGVCRFDPALERFERIRHSDDDPASLSDDIVTAILCDSAGVVWIGSWSGLNRLDGWESGVPRFTRFVHNPNESGSLGADRIWMLVESQGQLVIGLRYSGIDTLSLTSGQAPTFRHFRHDPTDPSTLSGDEVWAIAKAPDSTVWVGTQNSGLNRFDPSTGRCARIAAKDAGLETEHIRSLTVDSQGQVWIGARFQGLVRFDPDARTSSRYAHDDAEPYSLSHNQVVSMFEDREGLLWFGTWGGGVNKLDPRMALFGLHRHHEGDPHSLSADMVTAIYEDSTGTLWVGTNSGLNRRRPGVDAGFERIKVADDRSDPHPGGWINTIYEDRNGTLWVSLRHGAVYMLSAAGKSAAIPVFSAFPTNRSPALAELTGPGVMVQDRSGAYWFPRRNDGLIRWDGVTATEFKHDPEDPTSLAAGAVQDLYEDSAGSLWIATREGGLCRFDLQTQKFERFEHDDDNPASLSGNTIMVIAEGIGGELWIGTLDTGLNRLDPRSGRCTHYREADGLASDSISGILVDDHKRLWLATSRGIDRFDPATGAIVHYDERDGLQSDNFTSTTCLPIKTRGGLFYFGGPKGLNVFDPVQLEDLSDPPPVVLTDFLLFNRPVPIGDAGPVARSIGLLDEIELEYSDYLFGFEFAGLSYRNPAANQYRYKLDAYDQNWIVANASDRKAVFTGIPPGVYTFRVQASNGGAWSTPGVAIRVRVNPPWWRTWWAYLLYVVGTLGLVLGGVHLRVRAFKRRSVDLEALVAHRTAELAASEREAREAREEALEASKAKSVFLANMSHELRTPLNAVIGFAQVLERRASIEGEDRESLQIIQRSGEHLLDLINDVLSISKIEAGKLTLTPQPFDLGRLLKAVEAIVRVRAEAKGLDVVFDLRQPPPQAVAGDEGKLRQVLINLLGNAVKFTDRGCVTLRASWTRGRAVFDVEDTGYGISDGELARLFVAFSQTESGLKSKEGTGLGLAISRQIVQLMGGDIHVRSRIGEGTTFSFDVDLPLADASPADGVRRRVTALEDGQVPPRILIVDDTDENRLLLARVLAPVGFDVREAANGQLGVEAWERWQPDLIFMDMRMPVLDGREATRRIRERENGQRTDDAGSEQVARGRRCKIIALTASAFEHEHADILATGTDDLITKPCRIETLFEKIAEHLGVTYRYEEPEAKGTVGAPVGIVTAERFGAFPRTRIEELHRALSIGDMGGATATIERMRETDEDLAHILLAQIRAYQIDDLLLVLESLDPAS